MNSKKVFTSQSSLCTYVQLNNTRKIIGNCHLNKIKIGCNQKKY